MDGPSDRSDLGPPHPPKAGAGPYNHGMKTRNTKATAWLLLGLLLAGVSAPVMADPIEADDEQDALDEDTVVDDRIDRSSLRASNNNPITARRRALRTNLTTLLNATPGGLDLLISEMAEADKAELGAAKLEEIKTQYKELRDEAQANRAAVERRMRLSRLEPLERRYGEVRDGMFSLIFKVTAKKHMSDSERFLGYWQKRMDVQAGIDAAQRQARTQRQRQNLAAWEQELGGSLTESRLDQIFDNLGGNARTVIDEQRAITVTYNRSSKDAAFTSGVRIAPLTAASDFRPRQTLRTNPVPAVSQAMSYTQLERLAAQNSVSLSPTVTGGTDGVDTSAFARFMRASAPVKARARAVFNEAMEAVSRYSERYDVSPFLVMGFMGQESLFLGWDRALTALSYKGAQGLMQIMPGTQRGLGVTDPHDATQSVMGGIKYIHQMRDDRCDRDDRKSRCYGFSSKAEFDQLDTLMLWGAQQVASGSKTFKQAWNQVYNMVPKGVKHTIAAYNAGPGAVLKYGGVPPYRETQKYVPGVLSRMFQTMVEYVRATKGTENAPTEVALAGV